MNVLCTACVSVIETDEPNAKCWTCGGDVLVLGETHEEAAAMAMLRCASVRSSLLFGSHANQSPKGSSRSSEWCRKCGKPKHRPSAKRSKGMLATAHPTGMPAVTEEAEGVCLCDAPVLVKQVEPTVPVEPVVLTPRQMAQRDRLRKGLGKKGLVNGLGFPDEREESDKAIKEKGDAAREWSLARERRGW